MRVLARLSSCESTRGKFYARVHVDQGFAL